MKKPGKDPVDQYFRENLSSPDLKYNKRNWKQMEQLLRPAAKRRRLAGYWLSGIAALLAIFFSLWLFRVEKTSESDKNENKAANTIKDTKPASEPDIKPESSLETKERVTLDRKHNLKHNLNTIKKHPVDVTLATEDTFRNTNDQQEYLFLNNKLIAKARTTGILQNGQIITPPLLSVPPKDSIAVIKPDIEAPINNAIIKSKWAVSLAFAPDINSVNNFQKSSFGAGAGIGLSYQITNKIILSTGIAYAKKIYSASPDAYKSDGFYPRWLSNSSAVDADCRVLDIPLNINYLLQGKKKTTFLLSAGMSSYIMLNEKYTYIGGGGKSSPGYPPVANPNPSYSINNENRHILSVVNLSAGMIRPINKQTSIGIQPYVKLPVAGIGQGQVNLQSFGVNVQLNYSVPKKKK